MNLTVIKVGNKNRPATDEDLEDIRQQYEAIRSKKELSHFVTHHAVDVIKVREGEYTNEMVIYKIGDDEHPATEEDINSFKDELEKCLKSGNPLIWHHSLSIDVISK